MTEFEPIKVTKSDKFEYKIRIHYYESTVPVHKSDNVDEVFVYEMYMENDLTKYCIVVPYDTQTFEQIDRCIKLSYAILVELWHMGESEAKISNRFWLESAKVMSEGLIDWMYLELREIGVCKQH